MKDPIHYDKAWFKTVMKVLEKFDELQMENEQFKNTVLIDYIKTIDENLANDQDFIKTIEEKGAPLYVYMADVYKDTFSYHLFRHLDIKVIVSPVMPLGNFIFSWYEPDGNSAGLAFFNSRGYIIETSYSGLQYIHCLTCGRKSFNLEDIRQRYCVVCDKFHDDILN